MTLRGAAELRARIDAIGRDAGGPLLKAVGLTAVAEQKRRVRRKTGTTSRTIRLGRVTDRSVETIAAGAGPFLETGTRPHVIRPRHKRALAFASQGITTARFGAGATLTFRASGSLSASSMRQFGNGAFVVVRSVRHPGTKKQPFMLPGLRAAVEKFGFAARVVSTWNEAA